MSERPRLLHVFATFAPGGPQVRAARLFDALGDAYEHAVVAMDGRTDARELVPPHVPLELVDAPPRTGTFRTLRALRGLLDATPHDLLLTYNWGAIEALLAARARGETRLVHHEDGFGPDEAAGFKRRRIWLRRFVLKEVTVVVPSHTLETIARARWKVPASRLHVIPNGIDTETFTPAADDGVARDALRAELGVPAGTFLVGSVGHLRAEKNFARLVRTLARTPASLQLLLVGDGEERAAIERTASELGVADRVHLAGHRSDLAPLYRAMDAFAISSDTEQMPVALLEAMASGLAVASTDVGDVRAVLPDEQAELVVPLTRRAAETEATLAAALERLGGDPALRATLGAANRARCATRYAFAAMLAAHRARWDAALTRGE